MEVYLLDDNQSHLQSLQDAIGAMGHQPRPFMKAKELLDTLIEKPVPLVISDIRMPEISGLEVLQQIKSNPITKYTDVVLITGFGDEQTVVQALRKGAYDYITKPINFDELEIIIDHVAEHQRLIRENRELLEHFQDYVRRHTEQIIQELDKTRKQIQTTAAKKKIITRSPNMEQIIRRALIYHQYPQIPVLIQGETGTGKEVIAQLIHHGENGSDRPFVEVNCANLSGQLVESEIFGYEGGSFTGADPKGKKGKLELAGNGTLFLDEIGELPLEIQPKLLRVIENRTFYRVGGLEKLEFKARIICATNRNLETMVKEGKFRMDLFHRFSIAILQLPPLRERPEDIPILAEYFLDQTVKNYNLPKLSLTPAAIQSLLTYSWPGNVRELLNTIERSVLLATPPYLDSHDLIFLSGDALISQATPHVSKHLPISHQVLSPENFVLPPDKLDLEDHINHLVLRVLNKFNGNKSQAAKYLGLSWPAFQRRLQKAQKIAKK